jgi:hypothetical protein
MDPGAIQKTPVESMIAVSWIRVRSAHGNSFDHLVGGGEQHTAVLPDLAFLEYSNP